MFVCVCVCVCVYVCVTRKTLVCASGEDSRESVRSLESALICADFIKKKKILHLLLARTCLNYYFYSDD